MKVIKLGAIDSTNTYAKALLARSNVPNTTVIWTPNQTAGRGQQGNNWHTSPGNSLTFSLIKRLDDFPANRFLYINFAVSLGIYNALKPYKMPGLCIKWPNDIMSDGRKLGGILIETQLRGHRIQRVIAGVGINVNDKNLPGLPAAVSMAMLSEKDFNLPELLMQVARAVHEELEFKDGFDPLKKRYEDLLFRKDSHSIFHTDKGGAFRGIIQGVSESGKLLVRSSTDDSLREFGLNEVKLSY